MPPRFDRAKKPARKKRGAFDRTTAEPTIERERHSDVVYTPPTTPKWDDVPTTPAILEGRSGVLEITPLAAYISPASPLRNEIIAAMREGGIENPVDTSEVTDSDLAALEAEMHEIFRQRIISETARTVATGAINPYHDETHNYQVGQRLVDILRAMSPRPSLDEARILLLYQAPHHDAREDDEPHPGMAVRKESDGRTNEQVAAELIDEKLKNAGMSLYRRIQSYGMTLATANFWDTNKEQVRAHALPEYLLVMADLAGYREAYPEWARQSLGVLKERVTEWERDVTEYEAKKKEGAHIGNDVVMKLLERAPATTLEKFFQFQSGFVKYLNGVNRVFANTLIPGGEEAFAWTPALREKDTTVQHLLASAKEANTRGRTLIEHLKETHGTVGEQYTDTIRMIKTGLEELHPRVKDLIARTRALAS